MSSAHITQSIKFKAKEFIASLKANSIYRNHLKNRQNREYHKWLEDGKKQPPPHRAKQLAILEFAETKKYENLVETGTYLGDMVEAMRSNFQNIYSVELNSTLHAIAKVRFARCRNVHLVQGDSGIAIDSILKQISKPSIFWLDGHYSAGSTSKGLLNTPIERELESIRSHPLSQHHVILIDDARLFDGTADYPTIERVREIMANFDSVVVRDDIIIISKT